MFKACITNTIYVTFLVFSKSCSMDLMRFIDSSKISSFSGGIFAGLLVSSFTKFSKCCNLCQHGWIIPSGLPHMPCSSGETEFGNRVVGLISFSISVFCDLKNILNSPSSKKQTHATNLNSTSVTLVKIIPFCALCSGANVINSGRDKIRILVIHTSCLSH